MADQRQAAAFLDDREAEEQARLEHLRVMVDRRLAALGPGALEALAHQLAPEDAADWRGCSSSDTPSPSDWGRFLWDAAFEDEDDAAERLGVV